MPINNGMLGVSDISLISSNQLFSYDLGSSDSNGLHGNGAIAGVLNLNSENTVKKNGIDLNVGLGSFGKKDVILNLKYKDSKFSGNTNLTYNYSLNNFPYKIGPQKIEKINEHAQFIQYGVMQNLSYQISQSQKLSAHIWFQETDREIPPTTTQTRNQATQNDNFKRFAISYLDVSNKFRFESKLGYFDEANNFLDSLNLIDTHNNYDRIHWASKLNYFFENDYALLSKIEWNNIKGSTEFYSSTINNNQLSFFTQLQKNWNKQSIFLTLGNEWNSQSEYAFNPSIRYIHKINNAFSLDFTFAKVFRYPTLNELHWQPGGNLNLKNEKGWSQVLEIDGQLKKDVYVNFALYHRIVDNWILWSRPENVQFWSAYNITKVRSYGLELSLKKILSFDAVGIELHGIYTLSRSKNLENLKAPKIDSGDQLFYTPIHQGKLNSTLTYKDFSFGLNGQYYSSSIGINENLDDYILLSTYVHHRIGQNFSIGFVIENLTNTNYQIIERRAMPGRHFNINLNFKL